MLSHILIITMIFSGIGTGVMLTSVTVEADEGESSISEEIKEGDYVWLGDSNQTEWTIDESDPDYYDDESVNNYFFGKQYYKVIKKDDEYGYCLLLSENLWTSDVNKEKGISYYTDLDYVNDDDPWDWSDAAEWCDDFYTYVLNEGVLDQNDGDGWEKTINILGYDTDNNTYADWDDGGVFFLPEEDVSGENKNELVDLCAKLPDSAENDNWWLMTVNDNKDDGLLGRIVKKDGSVVDADLDSENFARPAFWVDLTDTQNYMKKTEEDGTVIWSIPGEYEPEPASISKKPTPINGLEYNEIFNLKFS